MGEKDLGVQDGSETLLEIGLHEEIKEAYLTYAMSVIISRALPDVRDGLKPSQRRILVAMHDLGLGPRSKTRKCAKICGDTSGNYHPHGEQVIYPTLVRLAQPFVMRYPLVEGQGNFGSIDGDPPAAMRYTEARMTHFAMLLLEDIDKDMVDFIPNYDETRQEPVVLPSKFPNLLCNGSTGIAVGMTTNIPPHHFGEIADAVIKLLDNPEVSLDELLKIVKGPDFPLGGMIMGTAGVEEAYRTGKGHIQVRGKVEVEESKSGKRSLVFTEIPYNVNKASLIEKIAHLVQEDRIQNISDIRDESDQDGLRIVIDLKKEANEDVVINQLYKNTQLQDTFAIVLLALKDNRPKLFNLKELLEAYRDFRIEVIRRRTRFLLNQAEEEAHILEGLLKAIRNIDDVIALIKKSSSTEEAEARLVQKFDFSERQAMAILKMALGRLTNLETQKLEKDHKECRDRIAEYQSLLADVHLIIDVIREDLYEMKEKYGDKRRTRISREGIKELSDEELIHEEEMVITITDGGYIKRIGLDAYRRQGRGGKGIQVQDLKEGDGVRHLLTASTHDSILLFTNLGKVYGFKTYELPELSRTAKGRHLAQILTYRENEKITSLTKISDFSKNYIFMATKQGVVKRVRAESFANVKKNGIYAITLDPGDELIGAMITIGQEEGILSTRGGISIHFKEEDVRSMGRTARGVIGIDLEKGDEVIGLTMVKDDEFLLTVSEKGYGKRTAFGEYRLQHRGGRGILTFKCTEKTGKIAGVCSAHENDEVFVVTAQGQIIRIESKDIRETGRVAQGVRLVRLEEADAVVAVNKIYKLEGEE